SGYATAQTALTMRTPAESATPAPTPQAHDPTRRVTETPAPARRTPPPAGLSACTRVGPNAQTPGQPSGQNGSAILLAPSSPSPHRLARHRSLESLADQGKNYSAEGGLNPPHIFQP